MDINRLLSGIDCECGRHHSCDIKYVYAESDAARRFCDGFGISLVDFFDTDEFRSLEQEIK